MDALKDCLRPEKAYLPDHSEEGRKTFHSAPVLSDGLGDVADQLPLTSEFAKGRWHDATVG
jgi:hypothetical protein